MSAPNADWKKRRIILVDPAIWPRYTRGSADLRRVYLGLLRVLRGWGAEVDILDRSAAPLDIWIRDWGCVGGVSFRYAPDYARGLYCRVAVMRAQCTLATRLRVPRRAVPIVLDGGNIVHNGQVAIVTEKVFRENAHLSRGEIEQGILSLGFTRVVFIPNEPGDEIGHSDGMCRFVSDRVLLVNRYDTTAMRSFGRRLRRVLRGAKIDAELVDLPWFSRGGRSDGVPSAEGCYMNFIQLAQGIILPAFSHPKDDKAQSVLAPLTRSPVEAIDATPLAKLGGIFNCVSLTV